MAKTNQIDMNEYYKDRAVSFGIQWVEEEKREIERAQEMVRLEAARKHLLNIYERQHPLDVSAGAYEKHTEKCLIPVVCEDRMTNISLRDVIFDLDMRINRLQGVA